MLISYMIVQRTWNIRYRSSMFIEIAYVVKSFSCPFYAWNKCVLSIYWIQEFCWSRLLIMSLNSSIQLLIFICFFFLLYFCTFLIEACYNFLFIVALSIFPGVVFFSNTCLYSQLLIIASMWIFLLIFPSNSNVSH